MGNLKLRNACNLTSLDFCMIFFFFFFFFFLFLIESGTFLVLFCGGEFGWERDDQMEIGCFKN